MKNKLEDLVAKYPIIFRDRHGDVTRTAMCWGFECGDGWYDLLDVLCANIQNHVDNARKYRARTIRFNRALKRAWAGDINALMRYHTNDKNKGPSDWTYDSVERDLREVHELREVPKRVKKVIAVQVKEKFGGLRFYYDGGDSVISGMVQMAEGMSYRTCEICGCQAQTRRDRWITTQCDPCYNNREQRRAQELADYNDSMEETYKNIDGC